MVALTGGAVLFQRRLTSRLVTALFVLGIAYEAHAASTLVLSRSRVEVSITWRSQYDGSTGTGIAIPISDVFGFFAFTDPSNPEVFVKVLDFGASSPLLLFYGGLTDFEYHLTYHNRCTGQDVKLDKAPGSFDGGADNRQMLAGCETGPPLLAGEALEGTPGPASAAAEPREYAALREQLVREPRAEASSLYLSKERIQVSLTWKSQYDGSTGVSIATPINQNFGFLSFFNAENPEVFVKVLDFGAASPLLLFYGGLTDFEYEVTFKNLCTNQTVVFRKPPGSYAGGADNRAMLAGCADPPLPPHLVGVKAVETRFRELTESGAAPLDVLRAVADYMKSRPEYVDAHFEESSSSVTGELTNGRIHIVSNSFQPGSGPAEAGSPEGLEPMTGGLVPFSGYARLLQGFGPSHRDAQGNVINNGVPLVNDLAGILTRGGYSIRPNTSQMQLTDLRSIQGDGYFWVNSHGGGAYFTNRFNRGTGYYAMCSNTRVTAHSDDDPANARDLGNDALVYYTPTVPGRLSPQNPSGVLPENTYYGINWKFVRTHWRFEPNAVVHSTVCVMMADVRPGPGDFVDAILAVGADVVFGWTGLSSEGSGYKAARYFTDRLLGANTAIGGIPVESPIQRPFPWQMVYDDMLRHHPELTRHEYVASTLTFKPRGKEAVLDPSIQELLVNEYDLKLYLKGDFGTKKGRVTVGTITRTDCDWKEAEITCPLPLTGSGSNGNVFVEVEGVSGKWRKSNVRQLLEWEMPFQYEWADVYDIPGLKFHSNGKLRWRGDVGHYRKLPGEQPFQPLRAFRPTKDSFVEITGSGTYNDGDCTTTLAGNARFVAPTLGAGLTTVLAAPMMVETGNHNGALGLGFGYPASPFTLTIVCPKGTSTVPAPITVGLLDGPATFPSPDPSRPNEGPFTSMTIHFNSDFRLPVEEVKRTITQIGGTLILGAKTDAIPTPTFDPTLPR